DRQVHRRLGDGVLRRAAAAGRPRPARGDHRDRDRARRRAPERAARRGWRRRRADLDRDRDPHGRRRGGQHRLRPALGLHGRRRRRERRASAREAGAARGDPRVGGGPAPGARRGAAAIRGGAAALRPRRARARLLRRPRPAREQRGGGRPGGAGMRRVGPARAAAAWLAAGALGFGGCASSGATGELLYRAGDLRGAIESWRAENAKSLAPRIAAVEAELAARVQGYIANARALESEGRLAEALLDYRLALELQPDDADNLAHVQQLARDVVAKRGALLDAYRDVRARGDLAAAEPALQKLPQLDPFEPPYQAQHPKLQRPLA